MFSYGKRYLMYGGDRMVNTKMIKAQMTLYEYTIDKLSKELGISSKTLSTRLNISPQKFTQEEIQK